MSRRALVLGAAAVVSTIAAACLVDIPDVVTDAGSDGSIAPDGSQDSPALPDAVVPSCEAGTCGAPAGFAPILFASDRSAACPPGTSTFDLPADPTDAGASACTCDCNVTTQPTCLPQTLVHYVDGDAGTWGQESTLKPVVDGGCDRQFAGFVASPHWAVPLMPPTAAGACTGTAKPDPSQVTVAPSRLCVDESCGTCAAPAGFQVCYAALGDLACPPGSTKHRAGAAADVTCSTCSSCSVTADCGGSVTLFQDSLCASPIGSPVSVDGGCAPTGGNLTPLGSIQYAPAVVNLACKPGKTTPTGVGMASPLTVCCP